MPIRREFRHHYRGAAWRAVRTRILARADDKCEACRVPNCAHILRVSGWWLDEHKALWFNGAFVSQEGVTFGAVDIDSARLVKIVLTIAHLNHTPGDDRDHNLKALCQWCHLHHDAIQHAVNARATRRVRKDAARPLLALLEKAS